MPKNCRGKKRVPRVDLTDEKDSLTSSLESETDAIVSRSVANLESIAAHGVVGSGARFWESQGLNHSESRSALFSPNKVKKPVKFENFSPRRTVSCSQLFNFETDKMSTLQQDLKPLTGSRAGLKQWVPVV